MKKKFHESGIPYQFVGGKSLYQYSEVVFLIACIRFLITRDANFFTPFTQTKFGSLAKIAPQLLTQITISKPTSQILKQIISLLGLEEMFKESPHQLSRMQELVNSAVQFNSSGLNSFLAHIDALAAHDFYDTTCDKVTLLTMHAAKGLEFTQVFVCGFEEGFIPYTKKAQKQRRA